MPAADKSWIIILLCAIAVLFGLSTLLQEGSNDNIGYAINLYQNFSPTINTFSSPNLINFSTTDNTKQITFSICDDAVYKTAWISVNGTAWQPITLTGKTLSGNWLQNTTTGLYTIARTIIPNDTGIDNYIITYSCTKNTTTSTITWNCHNNKWQIKTFNTTKTETTNSGSKIIIYAAGRFGDGAYPTMELIIDNNIVASWIVDGDVVTPTFNSYYYNYTSVIDKNSIVRVNYPNDVWGSIRDLRVDKIVIDGVTYESESPSNINTGLSDGTRCGGYDSPGNEWLVCSGYIQYNLSPDMNPAPNCSDNKQNQGETGVDCGGPCTACSTPALGTYYISPSGSDSASGSANAPWKSLAHACSSVRTSGYVIHVNAGIYTEKSQCNLAPDVNIEGEGNSLIGSIIKSHYVGGTSDWNDGFILLSGGTNTGQHISGIYFDGDSNTGDNGIVVYDRSHVSIYGCTFINFYQEAIRFWGSSNNVDNSIHDCIIKDSSASTGIDYRTEAIGLGYQTGFLFYNNTLTNNGRANGENGDGMRLWDEIYAPKIYNNHFIGPEVCNGADNYPFVIEFWNQKHIAGYGAEIYGNDFIGQVDFGSGGGKGNYDFAFYVHDNYFHATSIHPVTEWTCGLQIEEHVNDIIISNNLFQNLETPIYLCSQDTSQSFNNVKIYNNVFTDVVWGYQVGEVPAPGQYSSHGTGIMIGGSAIPVSVSNIYIWNNVFTAYSGRPAETAIWLPTANTNSNIYIQNNIFVGFATAPIVAQLQQSGGTLDNLVIQKNLYNNNGNNNNFLQKYFTATHVTDDGGIIGDPSFVSSTDFHLKSNSPAIGKGMNVGLTTDNEGSAYHFPPSIGAFEYP